MRESLMYGSVRGARGNSRPYRDHRLRANCFASHVGFSHQESSFKSGTRPAVANWWISNRGGQSAGGYSDPSIDQNMVTPGLRLARARRDCSEIVRNMIFGYRDTGHP